jgi:excisionase family DNA binding protein
MHRHFQSGMRENPASNRRHGSRLAVSDLANETCRTEVECTTRALSRSPDQADAGLGSTAYAGPPPAATAKEKNQAASNSASLGRGAIAQGPAHTFEPLIDSLGAAKLLGNIHVKTLQRYARWGSLPGYQIGGHWYFRVSELDSWLQSRVNLSCHPCRSK